MEEQNKESFVDMEVKKQEDVYRDRLARSDSQILEMLPPKPHRKDSDDSDCGSDGRLDGMGSSEDSDEHNDRKDALHAFEEAAAKAENTRKKMKVAYEKRFSDEAQKRHHKRFVENADTEFGHIQEDSDTDHDEINSERKSPKWEPI